MAVPSSPLAQGRPLDKSWLLWLALAAVVAWAGVNLVLVYQHILLARGPLHWDEASHSLQGLIIASDLRTGDLLAFLYDSYRQVYWPPVFSWISGAFFLLLGPNTETARLSSFLWILPLPVVLFQAARHLQPARPWLTGLLAAGLALTSVSLADTSTYAMLEAPGLLALSTGTYLYLRFVDRPTVPGAVWLGLALILTYLTKSNYGVLLGLAVILERLLSARLHPKAALWKAPIRYAFLVPAAVLLVWFAYPPKLRNTWTALVNSPYGPVDAYTLEGLLYYPKALASLIGPTWLLAVVLVAVAASLSRFTNPKVRFLVLLVFLQMGLATWSTTKLERHIITMLPPLFLLAAYWLTGLADWLWGRSAWPARALAALVPALVVAGSSQAFYADLLSKPLATATSQETAFRMVRNLTEISRRAGPLLLASTKDLELSPPQIDWYLATEGDMPVWAAGSLKESHQFRSKLLRALSPPLSEALDRIQERGQDPTVTRTLYPGFPMDVPQLLNEADYAAAIPETARRYQLRTVAVVQTQEGAFYYQKGQVKQALLASGYQLVESRDFQGPAATVKVYRHE